MKQSITFNPAYDKRSAKPNENYGIHGVGMVWLLEGELGVVQFIVFTHWHLPHIQAEMDLEPLNSVPYMFHKPQPVDVGYHSPKPMCEGQTEMKCDKLPSGKCYYDGSSLQATTVFNILLAEGSVGVWKELERRYVGLFGELK